MPTRQETFDIVARHLLTQKVQSMAVINTQDPDAHAVCAYRGQEGCKCAAGVLIPDDKYTPQMEGWAATAGQVAKVLLAEGHDTALASTLQGVHDAWLPDRWKERLAVAASTHGLNTDVLKEFA